jgi:hypothetical protein
MKKASRFPPLISRADRSVLKALYITCGAFLCMFVVFHIVSAFYSFSLTEQAKQALEHGIATDKKFLKTEGDAIATDPRVINALQNVDTENLIALLQEERNRRSIGLMGITDEQGVIVGRTKSVSHRGDNAFLATPQGRVVAQGSSVESIEISGLNPTQLLMTTARPVRNDQKMIGALFANYLLDDEYAVRFRETYLPKGSEVVFYTKEYGVYGNSFLSPYKREVVASHFNSGSEWINNGLTGKTIFFEDGTYYVLENIRFPGLEQSPGGALLFVPRKDFSGYFYSGEALVSVFVFLIFATVYHMRARREEKGWKYYILLGLVSILVFGIATSALYLQKNGYVAFKHIPFKLYNSTLRLQPEWGIYGMGYEQRFSIVIDSGDERINAVQAKLTFDPTAVEVTSLDMESSSCSYTVEKLIDASAGLIDISCVLLNTTGEKRSFVVADVVVKPLRTGTFEVSFDSSNSKVLAADGLGTNVLRASQGGSYRVDNFSTLYVNDSSELNDTGRSFIVFSPTHPNQNRWYNHKSARFVWKGTEKAVYAYSMDTFATTLPSNSKTITAPSIELPIPGDGIFYFHLRLASGGPTAHYRIQSDRTPPIITEMRMSASKIVAGDVLRVLFDAEDITSGVQNNYYVDLGNRLFLPFGSEIAVPFLEPGNKTLILRVYDGAGNYSEKKQMVHVVNS